MEEWSRVIFAPRWAPAIATALIVMQVAAIAWLLGSLSGTRPEQFGTLTGPGVVRPVPGSVARIRLAFQESAPEREIRALLHEIRGRIVEGPSAAGFYLVEVPLSPKEPAGLDRVLNTLQARPGIIRFAERIER